jgi:hypothetical protein
VGACGCARAARACGCEWPPRGRRRPSVFGPRLAQCARDPTGSVNRHLSPVVRFEAFCFDARDIISARFTSPRVSFSHSVRREIRFQLYSRVTDYTTVISLSSLFYSTFRRCVTSRHTPRAAVKGHVMGMARGACVTRDRGEGMPGPPCRTACDKRESGKGSELITSVDT